MVSRNQPSEMGVEGEAKSNAESSVPPSLSTSPTEREGKKEAANPASMGPSNAPRSNAVNPLNGSNASVGSERLKAVQSPMTATQNKAGGTRMGTFRRLWHF